MTPSQHLSSTLGRTRSGGTSRIVLTARSLTLLLGVTLALSSCSSQQAGAAAIVDDTTISDKDVQTVSVQLRTLAQGEQQLTPGDVLVSLVLAPYVLAEADRAGQGVPDAEALKVLDKVAKPSRATLDFVRMQLAIPSLTPAGKTSIVKQVGESDITVNPRYGTFDAQKITLVPTAPNWIKASASSAAK